MMRIIAFFCLLLAAGAYQPAKGQPIFEDVTVSAGLYDRGSNKGVTFVDYDNDGKMDIFVTRSGQPNLFYRNMNLSRYEIVPTALDVSRKNGMSAWADFNNDGLPDACVAGVRESTLLFQNFGDGHFKDISAEAGLNGSSLTESLGFFDYDLDGLLDLFIFNRADENQLLRNQGGFRFNNVMQSTGILGRSNAMGLAFADFDDDDDQDIYLVYDGHQANNLYRNNGDGTFTDVAEQAGVSLAAEGMGAAFADYDNDGDLDLYITNLFENTLFENNGDGTFKNVSSDAGVDDPGMGWGLTWLDYDNDGWLDLYVVNASSFTQPRQPNVLYKNNGDRTFSIVSADDPCSSFLSGFGGACADYNGDGYLDLFVTNEGNWNQLFRNLAGENNWLTVSLIGSRSNRDGIGARVFLRAGNLKQIREVSGGQGWFSQNCLHAHFGLASAEVVDELIVRWPTGREDTFFDISVNQQVTVMEATRTITAVRLADKAPASPDDFQMGFPHPNPARLAQSNESLSIPFLNLNPYRTIRIDLFNVLGQHVRTLAVGVFASGEHLLRWDGRNDAGRLVAEGIYLATLRTASKQSVRKILLLK